LSLQKNEKEKNLYKLQEAHKNQQMLLQRMQVCKGHFFGISTTTDREKKV
jgi:hypothetical protein